MINVGPRGFSINIFIPSGDPAGLRIVEKLNWTGKGLVFARSDLGEVRKRPELDGPGVYVMWGSGEAGQLPRVYVGEGTSTRNRMIAHHKSKDFWTAAAVFTSKDQGLNKAHIQYLEARLLGLADEAKRCELDNANVPQVPSLGEAEAANAESFLYDMLLCLPMVGVRFFQKPGPETPATRLLTLRARNITAQGFVDSSGFVVKSGSQAVKEELPSIHAYMSVQRSALIERGVLRSSDDDSFYALTQDYPFGSPSTAAGVLLGRPANGRLEWKDESGRTLRDLQEEDIVEP